MTAKTIINENILNKNCLDIFNNGSLGLKIIVVNKTFKNIIKPLETATLNSKFKSEPLNINEENMYINGSTNKKNMILIIP